MLAAPSDEPRADPRDRGRQMSDKRPFERARLDGGRVRRRNHGETESSGAKTGIPFSGISGASDVTRGAAASSRSQPPVVSSTSPLNNGERGLSSTARSRLRSAAATRPSFVSRRRRRARVASPRCPARLPSRSTFPPGEERPSARSRARVAGTASLPRVGYRGRFERRRGHRSHPRVRSRPDSCSAPLREQRDRLSEHEDPRNQNGCHRVRSPRAVAAELHPESR